LSGEIKSPWEVCYQNGPYLKVVQHPFAKGGGRAGIQSRAIVCDGSLIIPLDHSTNEVVMIERMRDRPEGQIKVLEPPGGAIDEGDTALECAKKELLEETGCKAEDWIQLYSDEGVNPIDGLIWTSQHLFLAIGTQKIEEFKRGETLRVVRKTFSELLEMTRENRFPDPLMTNALWFAHDWLLRNRPNLLT